MVGFNWGLSTRRKRKFSTGYKVVRKGKFIENIYRKKGGLGTGVIFQGRKPGFTVGKATKKGKYWTTQERGGFKTEAAAIRNAKKRGFKRITFLD